MGFISPTFYSQLLCLQIPKVQKDSQVKQLFALSGSAGIKDASKMLVKLTHGWEKSQKKVICRTFENVCEKACCTGDPAHIVPGFIIRYFCVWNLSTKFYLFSYPSNISFEVQLILIHLRTATTFLGSNFQFI